MNASRIVWTATSALADRNTKLSTETRRCTLLLLHQPETLTQIRQSEHRLPPYTVAFPHPSYVGASADPDPYLH